MKVLHSLLLFSLAAAWNVHALDITGKVVDKFYVPVAGAQVCAQGSSTVCTTAGADGSFHLVGTVGVISGPSKSMAFSLEIRHAGLNLIAPVNTIARLEWFDMQGRRLAAMNAVPLSMGANAIAAPATLASFQPVLFRLTSSSFSWEGMLQGDWSVGSQARLVAYSKLPAGPAALAKISATPSPIVATKSGMGTRTYNPDQEIETNVQIMLPAEGEVAIFDGKTLTGWLGDNADWSIKDSAIYGKMKAGGKQSCLFTNNANYSNFRLFIRSRRIDAGSSHMGFLFWGNAPTSPIYSFQGTGMTDVMPHDGGQWDYHSNTGGMTHTSPPPKFSPALDQSKWIFSELVACRDSSKFEFASDSNWMINQKYPYSTVNGPIGIQLHDNTVQIEHKDVFVTINPQPPLHLIYCKRGNGAP